MPAYLSEVTRVICLADSGLNVERAIPSRSGKQAEQFDTSLGTMVAMATKALDGEQFDTGQLSSAQVEAWRHSMVKLNTLAINILIRIVHHGVTIWTLPGSSSSQHVSLVGPAPSSWSTHITQHHLS